MKASDLFVKALENEGVRYVFGVPGEENLDLLESLRTSSITFVVTRHEQAAGFMAATLGRLTGHAGVCLSTLGPGATNFITAAAYATLGGMPAFFITGQKPIKKSKQGRFQVVDTVDIMQPVVKSTRQIVSPAAIPAAVRDAFRIANEERPGAVHLELPEDIAKEEAEDDSSICPSNARRPVADEKAITYAVERIETAKRPLILVGAAANRKRIVKMLRVFMDKTGIPAFSTQMGKGVVDERHPHFIGTAALSSSDFLHRAIEAADVILNIGHDVVEKPPFFMHPSGSDIIHFNFTSAQIDQVYHPKLEVIGDIANALWQVSNRITVQKEWDFVRFLEVKKALNTYNSTLAEDGRFPLIPQRIVSSVRRAMPDNGVVSLDNGMYKVWFARNYCTYAPDTLILDNALATMGAGVPAAIAAKLLYPEKCVIAVVGDGGFMMNSQEIETAMRLGIDLPIIILNDDAYGMIRWKQEGEGFPSFGLQYQNPNFVTYAESYGAYGHRVASADDLDEVFAAALSRKGVSLIEVPVDYSENTRVFNQELPRRASRL
ncbi:MAG: acetolactate synthase large subunit [Candidatus Paceibacteria bacterium]